MKHVSNLLETVAVKTGKAGKLRKNVRRRVADKGYDADALRNFLKKKGIQPQIPRKRNAVRRRGRANAHQCATISS